VPRHNEDLAADFEEVADLLSLQQANPFRIRAYRRAAQVVRTQGGELGARLAAGFDPDSLPGIGADLAGQIREYYAHGELPVLRGLRREVPAGLRELLALPGLGPRRVQALHRALRLRDREGLRKALEAGRVARVPGFGAGLERRLREALAAASSPARLPRAAAEPRAVALRDYLLGQEGVESVDIAGSYRRGQETVGDLDFVVCAPRGFDLRAALQRYDETRALQLGGRTRVSVTLRGGLQVDLRLVPGASRGAALYYFTGSKAHNLHLRRLAQKRGLKLNEYGLYRGSRRLAGDTEASIFEGLGLQPIAPELREDRGEIAAAQSGRLPVLVEAGDLRGDLHVHTDGSDGTANLESMRAGARRAGLDYLGIADHGRYLGIVHGLDADALARQSDAIDRCNADGPGPVLLKGVEVDVLESGALALPDAVLGRLDFVALAIHGHFGLSRRRQTERLLRAVDARYATLLAHPTCRMLGGRPAIDADWPRIFARASERPLYLEINAQPAPGRSSRARGARGRRAVQHR
jgi:DNA polymerase (family 10)